MKEQVLKIIESHSPEFYQWLKEQENKIKENFAFRDFYLAFSMASRIKGSDKLVSGTIEVAWGAKLKMKDWLLSRLGRVYLLIALSEYEPEKVEKVYQQLFETAELKELVALYSALSLLPEPEKYKERAAEGVRTNIGPVLEAVALGNPYPARFLSEIGWNQLVLKAVFTDKPLFAIEGLDERANEALALMLVNYAKERWAAGRIVSPELWRPVGKFLTPEHEPLITRMLKDEDSFQRKAALLACAEAENKEVRERVSEYPKIKEEIESGQLTWNSLGELYWANKES